MFLSIVRCNYRNTITTIIYRAVPKLVEEMDLRLLKKRGPPVKKPKIEKTLQPPTSLVESEPTPSSTSSSMSLAPSTKSNLPNDASSHPPTKKQVGVASTVSGSAAETAAIAESLSALNAKRPSKLGMESSKERSSLSSNKKSLSFSASARHTGIKKNNNDGDIDGVVNNMDTVKSTNGNGPTMVDFSKDDSKSVPVIVPFSAISRKNARINRDTVEVDRKCSPPPADSKPGAGGMKKNNDRAALGLSIQFKPILAEYTLIDVEKISRDTRSYKDQKSMAKKR